MRRPAQRLWLYCTIALVSAAWVSFGTLASAATQSGKPIRFEALSLDDGLSQSTVLSIHQDSAGFVWFGTEDGLNRYDGYEFVQYKQDRRDTNSLPNDYIMALAEDATGDMWIGTDGGGLVHWGRESRQFAALRADPQSDALSLSGNAVRALAVGQDGVLWAGTLRNGLNQVDIASRRVMQQYRHTPGDPQTLSSDEVYAVHIDRLGRLWVGTNQGLNWLDPSTGQIRQYVFDPDNDQSLSDNRVRAIVEDSAGIFWIGTRKGLNRLDPGTGEITRFVHDPNDPSSLSHDRVRTIFEDNYGRLWVGTARGLNLFHDGDGTFSIYRADPADQFSLPDSHIVQVRQDAAGILWIGTNSGGVAKWNPRAWSLGHYRLDALGGGEGSRNVTSFAEDANGDLWVGSFGGGFGRLHMSGMPGDGVSAFEPYTHDQLSDNRIMALLFDRQGQLWAGTLAGGLNRITRASEPDGEDQVSVFKADDAKPHALGANGIMGLYEDHRGYIWAGTFGGGVSRFDPRTETFEVHRHDPQDEHSLSSMRATALLEDTEGTLWVGTDSGGLNYLERDGQQWAHLRHDPADVTSLSADTVYALHVDGDGTLWVGTRAGLDRMVRGPRGVYFDNLSSADGLDNDVIYGIRPDERGNLWLSTNHGLSRYDPSTGQVKNYHREHGLQKGEFNFGAHFRTRAGKLAFGGANGFNLFDPRALDVNQSPPPVVLTAVSVLNTPVKTEQPLELFDSLTLGHRDDVVTFEFAALDFAAPIRNNYAYRLEGFDGEWVPAEGRRRVTYTNLDAGHYRFRVRASNSDGVWNNEALDVAVTVEPAPWRTWWAYLVYSVVGLFAVFMIMRVPHMRLRREEQYSARLETKVQERTEDLQRSNDELHLLNDRLQEASFTDPLTGLRNRRYLFEEVARDIALVTREREAEPGADLQQLVFLMIDLDHFKPINDGHGHAAGDQLLIDISRALDGACRSSDFTIRWGGDEFLVAARRTTPEEAEALAQRICTTISQLTTQLENGAMARTSCSIGYASYPFVADGVELLNWEQVLGVADRAMYAAKDMRNAYVGFEASSSKLHGDELYSAIQEDPEALIERGLIRCRSSVVRRSSDQAANAHG